MSSLSTSAPKRRVRIASCMMTESSSVPPLMVTMLVAIFAVHWDNGWAAIADSSAEGVAVRLSAAKEILQEHGHYEWLTEKGNFVILNNGIEFGVTYLLMCFSLLFTGGGRFTSVDYFLAKLWPAKS